MNLHDLYATLTLGCRFTIHPTSLVELVIAATSPDALASTEYWRTLAASSALLWGN